MEFNTNNLNYNKNKKTNRFKSVSNVFTNKLLQIERSNSNINSSTSKKTAGFEESLNFLTGIQRKMNSFSIEKDSNKLRFSCNNNLPVQQSQEFSMKDIKEKTDANNGNYTNINISIVNPNFSINNVENSNRGTNVTNQRLNFNIINNTLLSFQESNNNIENEEKCSKKDNRTKMIASIYKDYLENKSNDETFSENFVDETKKNMFKEYLKKKKIIQYEYNTKGIISGFAAYMYPNEEIINKDKICLNININKLSIDNEEDIKKDINYNSHLINFFSLFCGGEKEDNDELPKFLKNNFKDIILNDKEIISNPQNAIKNSFIKCEIDYINNYLEEEKYNCHKNLNKNIIDLNNKIKICSLTVLLNIDEIFYIANIGKSISIISSNYSKKVNYLVNNINFIENNNNVDEKNKSFNSLYNSISYNNNDDLNNNNKNINNKTEEKCETDNSQIFINASNISAISANNNFYLNNNNLKLIRTFPGKILYDFLPKNFYSNFRNNNIKKNSFSIRNSKSIINRKLSTTFAGLGSINLKNKSMRINNYMKDAKNSKNKNTKNNKDKDNNSNHNSNSKFSLKNKIISSYPDIVSFKFQKNIHDFILIGCKKIFEKLTYDKICKIIYETMKKCIRKNRSFEMYLGCVVKDIIKKCIGLGVTSNISCLFICFEPIKNLYLKHDINAVKNVLVSFYLPLNNKNNCQLYDEFLTCDFIDIDKINNYNKMIIKEMKNMKKSKNYFNTNIINREEELKSKIYNNIDGKYEDNNKIKKKKKCCCLTF